MNYDGVTPDIAADLLVLKGRIKASKIPPSKLDEQKLVQLIQG